MPKLYGKLFIAVMMSFLFIGLINAQEKETVIITGKIDAIAEDGANITVDGKQILTTSEFIEDALFEVGDKVEITAEKTDKGLQAIAYKYIYEDETGGSGDLDGGETPPSE